MWMGWPPPPPPVYCLQDLYSCMRNTLTRPSQSICTCSLWKWIYIPYSEKIVCLHSHTSSKILKLIIYQTRSSPLIWINTWRRIKCNISYPMWQTSRCFSCERLHVYSPKHAKNHASVLNVSGLAFLLVKHSCVGNITETLRSGSGLAFFGVFWCKCKWPYRF